MLRMVVGFIDDTDALFVLMTVFPISRVIRIQTSFRYSLGVAAASCCFLIQLRQGVVSIASIVSFYPQQDTTSR